MRSCPLCHFPLDRQRIGSHLAWCLYECAALGEAVGVQIVPIGGVEVRLLVLRGTRVG